MIKIIICKIHRLLLSLKIEGWENDLASIEKQRINDRNTEQIIQEKLAHARRRLLLMIMEGDQ